MTDDELEALLQDIEADWTERKSSISDKEKICQAICAFCNDLPNHKKPGVLFIGANDNGSCTNLVITDQLLQNLSAIRSDGHILPIPATLVQKRTIGNCDLAVVIVQPADAPPVRYKGQVWVMVGPRQGIASAQEEQRLAEKRKSKDLPFDLQPIAAASLDDLDLEFFQRTYLALAIAEETLQENHRSVEQQLTSLRFATIDDAQPTVLGILTIGSDPLQFFPGAYIEFLRFEGQQLTDPIKDNKRIDGPLSELLHSLDEVLKINISTAIDFTT
ncbi:helix-turn-helix domain-containing protein [Candidatus Cyanaurora vandensis]|uniref:AlbA family DNA-binding domain-containing protein n=1 Tax=Candidatus Cyanaurora vandensis TaxID=2714958 RepID=UPI00257FF59E|nr:RNA-binding domain-containing protein [Candidatus Cyanaurora vandensis]